jgi:GNAT superfamily N-acetyltransferase
VADLAVVAEHRGQGIGRHLLAAIVALADRRGCELVGAVAPSGGGGSALLAAAGFRVLDGTASPRRWERRLATDDEDAR